VYDAGYKYKLTVYKNSPADKFFSSTHSEITVTEVVKRLANPYIKDEPKKEDEENTSSKNTTSKKENIKDNSSKTESVVSKPTESVITEPLESEEDLTIGATENNVDNVNEEKPKKTNKIWVIVVVAAVVLLAGGAAYWIARKKKKV
jgi:cobalamin biosynthesis Mg chelatase CobN